MSYRQKEDGGKCNQFFMNCDLYANPINLSYNNKRQYQTSYGGLLTLISGVIIIIWLGMQALQVKHVNFTFSETQELIETDYTYYVNQTDFVAATMVKTTDNVTFNETTLSLYVATVYAQIAWNEAENRSSVETWYNSTSCSNTE